ncbi:MAG: hypothetical protein V2I54_07500, partial [Bacteroidales bacterium]|nr:hypothetical protein [Bacteroidales bacterium]
PFRTEKLSPLAPMVLHTWESRSPPILYKPQLVFSAEAFFTKYELFYFAASIIHQFTHLLYL